MPKRKSISSKKRRLSLKDMSPNFEVDKLKELNLEGKFTLIEFTKILNDYDCTLREIHGKVALLLVYDRPMNLVKKVLSSIHKVVFINTEVQLSKIYSYNKSTVKLDES